MLAQLPVSRTDYAPETFLYLSLVLFTVRGWVNLSTIIPLEGLLKLIKFNCHIRHRTRGLPYCSIALEPLCYYVPPMMILMMMIIIIIIIILLIISIVTACGSSILCLPRRKHWRPLSGKYKDWIWTESHTSTFFHSVSSRTRKFTLTKATHHLSYLLYFCVHSIF
jgi:hypothetical protein